MTVTLSEPTFRQTPTRVAEALARTARLPGTECPPAPDQAALEVILAAMQPA